MTWQKKHSIKKIFNKRYTNASNINENIILKTGVWEDPKLMISSSFIGGGNLGKTVFTNGILKNDGTLKFDVDMKDELMTEDFMSVIPNGTILPLKYTLKPCNGFAVTFTTISEPEIVPPTLMVRFRIKKNGSIIYQSSIAGESATPYDHWRYVSGNRRFLVAYVCYSNFDIKYEDKIEFSWAEESSGIKTSGYNMIAYSSIKKSTNNLPNEVDILATE